VPQGDPLQVGERFAFGGWYFEIVDMDGRERASHRIPYGAHLMVDHGHIVSKGDRIAEWDPFMMPVITEKGGIVVDRTTPAFPPRSVSVTVMMPDQFGGAVVASSASAFDRP
jgi:hypothetical protein